MEIIDADETFNRAEALCLRAVDNSDLLEEYKLAMRAAQSLENNGWRKRTGMTQHDIILKHLKKAGSITRREADSDYSIASLTKRVSEMRELGHDIVSTVKFHPVTHQKYVRYTLGAPS